MSQDGISLEYLTRLCVSRAALMNGTHAKRRLPSTIQRIAEPLPNRLVYPNFVEDQFIVYFMGWSGGESSSKCKNSTGTWSHVPVGRSFGWEQLGTHIGFIMICRKVIVFQMADSSTYRTLRFAGGFGGVISPPPPPPPIVHGCG